MVGLREDEESQGREEEECDPDCVVVEGEYKEQEWDGSPELETEDGEEVSVNPQTLDESSVVRVVVVVHEVASLGQGRLRHHVVLGVHTLLVQLEHLSHRRHPAHEVDVGQVEPLCEWAE